MDYGHKQSDVMLQDLEKRIKAEYKQAILETQKIANERMANIKKNEAEMRKLLKDGKITRDEMQKWWDKQFFMREKYSDMQRDMLAVYQNADKVAMQMINEHRFDVYALNYNYGTYEVEKGANINTSFALYDRNTVTRLVKDDPKLLPPPGKVTSERIRRGELQRWNRQQIQSVMTQGILQGQSVDKIAKNLAKTVGEKNEYQHYRAARTMTTSAENAGRIDAYKRAEELGIKMKKQWLAAHDSRTRKSHRHYDGMAIPLNEEFATNLAFPGDPLGPAEEVYNCRCTLVASFDGFETDFSKEFQPVGYDTYEDWVAGHKTGSANSIKNTAQQQRLKFYSQKLDNALGADYTDFETIVQNSETKGMYNEFADECKRYTLSANGGCYRSGSDHVEFSFENHIGMNKYSTVAHEIGHMMDAKIGRADYLNFAEIDLVNARCSGKYGVIKPLKICPSQSDEFLKAVRTDMEALNKMGNSQLESLFWHVKGVPRNATSGVQDALDGFYSARDNRIVHWGHGNKYYNRFYNDRIKYFNTHKDLKDVYKQLGFDASNQEKVKRISRQYEAASEAWANGMSALTCGGDELKAMDKYMPNTMKLLREIAARY